MTYLTAIEPFLRKTPKQHRSRMRLDAILDATAVLLHETGTDRVTVTMIADRLQIASSSIYEYVEDVSQLIAAVAVRGQERTHAGLLRFGGPVAADQLHPHLVEAANFFLERYLNEPGLRVAMAYIDADPRFASINIADSRRSAVGISYFLLPGSDRAARQAIADKAFLLMHLAHAAAALLESLDAEERARLIHAYVDLVVDLIPPAG